MLKIQRMVKMQTYLKMMAEETKEFFVTLAGFFNQYYKDFFEGVKAIDKKELTVKLLSVLGISIAGAFFCYLREGTGDLYMSIFIPAFLVNAFIVFFGCVYKSSKIYSLLTVFLIITGFALQIFMLDPESAEAGAEVYHYVTYVLIGIVLSILILPVLVFVASGTADAKVFRRIIAVTTIVLYLVLCVFATEINGAKAWIIIGKLSIQVTEITKVLAGVYFSLCLTDKNLTEKSKGIKSFLMLVVHALFLAVIGEFGTLGMILIVFFVLKMLFIKNKMQIISEFIVLSMAFFAILGVSYCLYTADNTVDETVSGDEAVTVAAETEELSDDEASKVKTIYYEFIEEIAEIYPKFNDRMSIFLDSGEAENKDTQIYYAKKALWYVEWFGTEKGYFGFVPEYKSDFVFIYLVVRWGIVGAALVLLSLIFLFAETIIHAARSRKGQEAVFAICFIIFIVGQSLLSICSNLGLLPVFGVTFGFLSDGGSAMFVNLLMSLFIIYFMRTETAVSNESEGAYNV